MSASDSIEMQQVDGAGLSLLAQKFQTDAAARDGGGVLPADQGVARPAPAIVRLRRSTESQPADTRTPPRRSIATHSRGKVQCRSWASPSASMGHGNDSDTECLFVGVRR